MGTGVVDAGVALGWILRRPQSLSAIEALFRSCLAGKLRLVVSAINLAEIYRHTSQFTRATGLDPLVSLRASGVEVHRPDEAVAKRASALRASLADAFAAATALELGARLYTTDSELVRQLRGLDLAVTKY
ncbi:MAG: PIN domain-containing protein [Myxococcales bacterium]|nr:PIN domain-containing protein [Myxococcales bacterium]